MNRERENAKIVLDGSMESRAIARLLAQQRTAKPKLSQYDEDAHLIYCRIPFLGHALPCGYALAPSSEDIQHTAVYARGMEVSNMLRSPLVPSGLREDFKRPTPASRQFDLCFGREPVTGDVLHFHQVAVRHHADVIENSRSVAP